MPEEEQPVRACHALPCVWEPMVHGGFARPTPAHARRFFTVPYVRHPPFCDPAVDPWR